MESLERVLADLELGSHLCCVYSDREVSLSQISLFVVSGLERGEKCLYVADDRSKKDIVEFIDEQGVGVEGYLETGQLEFLTGKESYLKDGYFDPDEMIDMIESEESKALDEGYNGLRITGEMTWVLSDLPGTERLMEYEMKLNEFFPGSNSMGLCQYNENKFSPETLIDVIYVHPKILLENSIYDNPYYMPPDLLLDRLEGKVSWKHYERMREEIKNRSKLEEKRDLFKFSIEKALPEVYWITPKGRFIYANEKVREKLGYSEKELKELYVWDVDPNYPEERREEFWERLKEQKTQKAESFHITKSGYVYPVEITSHYLEFKGEEYEFCFAEDITERKKAEEEIRELSQFRKTIIQDANVWINVLDTDGNVKVWNKAAERISGYSKEEVIGHDKIWRWLYPDEQYRQEITQKVGQIFQGEELENYETTIQCKNGGKKTISWTSHPLEDNEGEIIGSIAIGKDITEQKEAKERKKFLNTLLRQDLGSKTRIIQGHLQLLKKQTDIPIEQKKHLEKAIKTGREADEILGLARKLQEIEKTDWSEEKDIINILNHVVQDISTIAKREKVQIQKTQPDTTTKVKGNYSLNIMFSQILLTRIQTTKPKKIKIDTKEKEEKILVKIEDDGEPLPKDIANMFSGKPYTGETTGVSGARYYMIRQIADHNHAEIKIQNSELGGARFDIYLQAVEGEYPGA
ncbi:MEDS domain-containing protein [Methanonatronarchaeum sp. AMET-Sl]|uniref:MEDS domain-containing protein n=1 Tax=Methanonatronarchaeum sp. AMET-Sl TaxID=3037654 RepID=UPI00244E5B7D|nr:MEDS domain-containing protein [Methanonatronarchaeum sp. AMET-Sl]WGI18014.1 MEDS domain-containing protein [Methanonatronarchaeum sp. AMET-Sl]